MWGSRKPHWTEEQVLYGIQSGSVTVVPNEDVSMADSGDAGVLLNYGPGDYFALNSLGVQVWRHLAAGDALDVVCNDIADQYEVEIETVQGDVAALIADLAAQSLVRVA
jgi:hypothetical protein